MELENNNWKKYFLEKDILDDFDIFVEYGRHKKRYYSLSGIINEFIDYMEYDINELYEDKYTRNAIKKHIRGVCFRNKGSLLGKYGERGVE